MRRGRRRAAAARAGEGALALVLALGAAACSASEPSDAGPGPDGTTAAGRTPGLDAALSEPREDSVYPDVGDPGVDALHYDLALSWDPDARRLEATERLRFRATADADVVRLDLGEPLEVGAARLDGRDVAVRHVGKDLVVEAPVEADARHTLALAYAGTPEPVAAPTSRGDFSTTGWHTTAEGRTWTMQEPFGAYTWYAVNDHPSDKALYDISVEVPAPWTGVAGGQLVGRTERDGLVRTSWRLSDPAASYLVTVATGPFTRTTATSTSGVPITWWTPPGLPEPRRRSLASAPQALDWLEERLGPYPFDTLGLVVVESASAMETQSTLTLGDGAYPTSRTVVLHELAHQWYGDLVTPHDWRDVWMNEGMATYLQLVWAAEHGGLPLERAVAGAAAQDRFLRRAAGPPGDYDPQAFGDGNVYLPPAVMWHRLRERVGEEVFWRLVRDWPAERAEVSTGRADYAAWLEEAAGEDLDDLLEAWLLGSSTPRDTAGE